MNMKTCKRLATQGLFLASALTLVACGGGSGGGGSDTASLGSAAIMVTDASIADLEEVKVTLETVTLTGTDGAGGEISHTVSNLDRTLNLKHLTTTSHLLDLVEGIPAGTYDHLTLQLTAVEVDDWDDDEDDPPEIAVDQTVEIDLSANPIVIAGDGTTTVTIDFDLGLSLSQDAEGNWTWQSRVFVRHGDDDDHKEAEEVKGLLGHATCDGASDVVLDLDLGNDESLSLILTAATEIEDETAQDDEEEDLDLAGICDKLGALGDGETLSVEVKGSFEGGAFTATKLEIEDPNRVKVKGVVKSLTPTTPPVGDVIASSSESRENCSDTYASMTVVDTHGVETIFHFPDADIELEHDDSLGCDALAEDLFVKVLGTRQEDDTILVEEIKLEEREEREAREYHEEHHTVLSGTVSDLDLDQGSFTLTTDDATYTVRIDDLDEIVDDHEDDSDEVIDLTGLVDGACLELSGEFEDDGSVEAENVVVTTCP